jgi:hypothetical protein
VELYFHIAYKLLRRGDSEVNTFFDLLFVPSCCQDRVRGANAESSDEIARLNAISLPRERLLALSCRVSQLLHLHCGGNF